MVLLALFAACKTDNTNNPVIPGGSGGGTGGGGSGTVDAPATTADAMTIAGRVCLASDARDLTACAGTGAGSLTVTLGTATATTNDDGTFAIAATQTTSATWHVTGSALVTSVMPFGTVAQIPALTQATYGNLALANGIVPAGDQGALFARIVHAGAALANATATIAPPAQFVTYYDGSSAAMWNQNATGTHGVAWIPGASVGTATLTVEPMGGSAQMISAIPIENAALTFVVVDVP